MREHVKSEEEKEFTRRMLNGSDAAKKLAEGIEALSAKLKKEITPQLQDIANEAYITQRPEAKKDMVINGKKVIVSLISDGRVMIDFGVFDDAQDFYGVPRINEREFDTAEKLGEYVVYYSLPLYKRIFKKRPV